MARWQQIEELQKLAERESGAVHKDWGGKIAVALVYPNTYYVGMSSLALHALYRLFNAEPDMVAERAFWTPGANSPALSVESQRLLSDFAVFACSMSYELDYFHFVSLLRQADIPVHAREREETDPIVLMGGPAITANPAPLAPLVDAFVIGEVEPIFDKLVSALRMRLELSREETLEKLSRIPGVLVPGISQAPVARQWLRDLDTFPTHSVVLTPRTEFGDMYLIEIARGCGRGCRFCLAGYTYRPMRERSLDVVLEQAAEGLNYRRKVGLVSAAVSDYPRRDELVSRLRDMGAAISVSSLRADSLSPTLLQALVESGSQTLTLAPEAGSERLRRVINKHVAEEQVLSAARLAREFRFPQLKLYFMIGLPSESDEDIEALCKLAGDAAEAFGGKVTVNLTPFVPKAHTPFECSAMASGAVLEARLAAIQGGLRSAGIELKAESIAWARIQGILARGGPELADVLASVTKPSLRAWRAAFEGAGLSEADYLDAQHPSRSLPWKELVATGVKDSYLARELRASEQARETTSCPTSECKICGVC